MKNNPLILQLSALNRKEMTRFKDFVDSPFFNKHKEVRALVGILSEIYPDFSEKNCARTALFQKLFVGEPHHQPTLAILFSYAMRLLEQFMVAEGLSETGAFHDKTLYFKQLRKRNQISFLREDLGKTEIKTTKQVKQAQAFQGDPAIEYERKYRAAAEKDAIALVLGQPGLANLAEKQLYLDAFYLTEKLRDACEMLQRSRLLKANLPTDRILESLIQCLSEDEAAFENFVSIKIYFQVYNLLKNNDLSSFHKCLETVNQRFGQFSREEAQNIFNYLQNHCIEQINRGNLAFLQEVFKLYKLQLHSQMLLVNGVLPEWHYKNIVTTALRLDEREWVRDFIEHYRPSLAPDVAGNAYSYNLAAYFYHIGQQKAVLPLLVQVEYTDLRYNLDAKSLLLRTYFDLGEDEALLAHAEAFTQFVKRNKSLTDFQKKGYFNLIRFAKKVFLLKQQHGFVKSEKWQEALNKLQSAMKMEETVFNKAWLEMKLEEVGRLEIGN